MYKPPKEALFHKSAWLFSDLMVRLNGRAVQCTEVLFDSFLSGGFTTMAVLNPPEKKLANAPLCPGCMLTLPLYTLNVQGRRQHLYIWALLKVSHNQNISHTVIL